MVKPFDAAELIERIERRRERSVSRGAQTGECEGEHGRGVDWQPALRSETSSTRSP